MCKVISIKQLDIVYISIEKIAANSLIKALLTHSFLKFCWEYRKHTSEKNRTWEEERTEVAFGKISWEDMLTQPKNLLGKLRSLWSHSDWPNNSSPLRSINNPYASGSEHYPLDRTGKEAPAATLAWQGPTVYNIRKIDL